MTVSRSLGLPLAIVIVAVLFAIPSVVTSNYHMSILVTACVFTVLAVAFNIVYGYVGLLSLCQVGFWGLSAYTVAILTTRFGLSPWLAVLAGGLVATAGSLVIGYAAVRVSRHSFAIVSLVFALLLQQVAYDWTSVTRSAMGIPGLPSLSISLPGGETWTLASARDFYYAILIWALITVGTSWWILHSRVGRAFVAIRENEPLAYSHGIDVIRYKLLAFTFSAFVTGIAGGLFCLYLTIVDPTIFDFYYTEAMLIMVIVGGAGSFWPVIVSAIVFSAVPELLRFSNELRLVIYGAVLIAVMLLMPNGFASLLKREPKRPAHGATPAPEART